jgi:hypothetical protein
VIFFQDAVDLGKSATKFQMTIPAQADEKRGQTYWVVLAPLAFVPKPPHEKVAGAGAIFVSRYPGYEIQPIFIGPEARMPASPPEPSLRLR